ncbi:tol-pal system protein YbgF [Rhodoferax sp.]|jgi:tol-pal system protein YbgF|uniref:tol-pal system protein YbgF n=1 Tax=Rhodoferax sp. TaxID=50421 RepID=UPI003783AFF3
MMGFKLLSRPGACKGLVLALALVFASAAQAGLFDDDEARRAILELRQRMDAMRQSIDTVRQEADQKNAEEVRRATEESAQLRRALLDLQNQLSTARAEVATLRGLNEQLVRDVSELQRKQKDAELALEDRLRKFEPMRVTVDGKEFMAEPAEKRDFEASLATFRTGDFANAALAFVDFLSRNPQTGYRASALFWLGNAQYATKDYKSALTNFRSLVAQSPGHVRIPETMLAVANCQIELKDLRGARKTLEELIAAHPSTDAAGVAKDRLARLK